MTTEDTTVAESDQSLKESVAEPAAAAPSAEDTSPAAEAVEVTESVLAEEQAAEESVASPEAEGALQGEEAPEAESQSVVGMAAGSGEES